MAGEVYNTQYKSWKSKIIYKRENAQFYKYKNLPEDRNIYWKRESLCRKSSEIEVSNRYSEIITYMYALLSTKF